jgi:hypothetical protein
MVMSATPSAPTSMVTRIDPAMAPPRGPRDRSVDGEGGGESWERELGVLAEVVTCTALFMGSTELGWKGRRLSRV